MSAHQPALESLTALSQQDKLNNSQQQEIARIIGALMSSREGLVAVLSDVRPIRWSRPVLRALVSEANRILDSNRSDRDPEIKELAGNVVAEIDTYSADEEAQAILYQAKGLAPGSHVLTIVATGQMNIQSRDPYIAVDAFDINF